MLNRYNFAGCTVHAVFGSLHLSSSTGHQTGNSTQSRLAILGLGKFLITEWLRLEGTSGDGLVEAPCSKHGQGEQVAQVGVQSGFE